MAVLSNSQYRKKTYIQLVLRLIGGELIGVCFAFFYVVAKEPLGFMANIAFGICAPGCLLCILADYFLKLGGKMKGNVTLHKEKPEPKFGLLMGVCGAVPYYITYCLLIVSKLGLIGSMTGVFKLFNAPFMPIIDIFAPAAILPQDISWGGMLAIGILPLSIVAVCHLCYKVSYENIDVAKKMLYKNYD